MGMELWSCDLGAMTLYLENLWMAPYVLMLMWPVCGCGLPLRLRCRWAWNFRPVILTLGHNLY